MLNDKKELKYIDISKINHDKIRSYLRASVALPFYSEGVDIAGEVFYDGAVIDNIPIYPLLKMDVDYIFCIYFDDVNYIFENEEINKKIVKLCFLDDKRISNSIIINHKNIEKMINVGYAKTKEFLKYHFMKGKDNLNNIYSLNLQANGGLACNDKIVRLTGDVIVTNMNKLLKKVLINKVDV